MYLGFEAGLQSPKQVSVLRLVQTGMLFFLCLKLHNGNDFSSLAKSDSVVYIPYLHSSLRQSPDGSPLPGIGGPLAAQLPRWTDLEAADDPAEPVQNQGSIPGDVICQGGV